MPRIKNGFWNLLGVSIASLYALYYACTSTTWHFIDSADLMFHEAGHVIFLLFGEFISVCMGSGFQIFLPLFIAFYFLCHRQRISGAICLMWVGINLINVSVYAGDAIVMQLPLLGGDGVMHDWNYILTTLDTLSSTPTVATTLYGLGAVSIGIGIALSYFFALEQE